ncbi:MAG: xanthine dehydrogenase family protein subunit M [Candidatus Sumerlaeia bacterium]|nr:xanthine dehydrogenase family protein subunit M [Candidatus Sumerlaeia bacterium]
MNTRTNINTLKCLVPFTIAEALEMKAAHPDAFPIAGGTDVMVWMNDGKMPGRTYISLHRLAGEWRHVTGTSDGGISIGALANYTDVRMNPLVIERWPLLVESARVTGALQIQNRGTLVGNVANGSPAADTVPVLMVYDAVLVLANTKGERRVPLSDFYTGYRQTIMDGSELITAIELPHAALQPNQYFRKVGTREAQAISKVVCAGGSTPGGKQFRLAWGSVAPTTIRSFKTEETLANGADAEEAWEVLKTEISPISDIRSTAEYRLRVCRRILEEFIGHQSVS